MPLKRFGRRTRFARRGFLLVLVCTTASLGQSSQREEVEGFTPDDGTAYQTTIDSLFGGRSPLASGERCRLVLRFLPSSQPESQIEITYGIDGKVTLRTRYLKKSLHQAMGKVGWKLSQRKTHWKVDGESISVNPALGREWLEEAFQFLADSLQNVRAEAVKHVQSKKVDILLDPAEYQVRFDDSSNSLALDFAGPQPNEVMRVPGALPIIRWAVSIAEYPTIRRETH